MDEAPPAHRSASGLRSLLWAAAFAVGSALPSLHRESWPALLGSLAALTLLPAGRRPRVLIWPLLLGATVALGHRFADPLPSLLSLWTEHGYRAGATPVEMRGRVLDTARAPGDRTAIVLALRRFEIPGRPPFRGKAPGGIRIRITAPASAGPDMNVPRPGDLVDLTARVGPARNFRNPGAFDYSSYLAARGITLIGTVKSARLIRVVPARGDPLAALPARARDAVVGLLGSAAGGAPDGADDASVSFLAALLVGERDDLPADFEDSLIRAGVYHIVALSGFNVALIAAILSALLRVLPVGPRARRVLLGACVLGYWFVATASGSIARAAVMSLLGIVGALLGRRVPGAGAIGPASVLIIGVRPAWAFDPGCQLSFAATLGLILLPLARDSLPKSARSGRTRGLPGSLGRRTGDGIRGSIRASCSALFSTALVSARHFHALAPVGIVANLFAVPLASLLLLLGLLICAAGLVLPAGARALFDVARFLIDVLSRMSSAAAGPSWCSFAVLPPAAWIVLTSQSAIVIAGFGGRRGRRAALLFMILAVLLTVAAGRFPAPVPTGRLEVTALDVGQGDALLVRFPGGPVMLIDAGGFARSSFDVGRRVVAPAIRALGVLRLDILAITHAHRDHLGGAPAIMRSFSPGAVWLGRMPEGDRAVIELEKQAVDHDSAIVFPRRGAAISLGGVRVEVLNPARGTREAQGAENDDSLVLRLSFGARSALLTGDLEGPLETELVDEGRNVRADLLKVGHHGSRTSTTGKFLARVLPGVAVISAGSGNPWGHPDAIVLKRLRAAGVPTYRTDRDGAFQFSTDGVSSWRALPLTRDAPFGLDRFRTDGESSE